MSQANTSVLPDSNAIVAAAHMLVDAAPAEWREIMYVMWYVDVDAIRSRMWAVVDRKSMRLQPPDCEMLLHKMRDQQIAAGHQPWLRCDITLSRKDENADPDFKVDFKYEIGKIPE